MSELGDSQDPMDPRNAWPITYIMLNRIYDLMVVIAANADSETTEQLVELHKNGMWYSPLPAYQFVDDEHEPE